MMTRKKPHSGTKRRVVLMLFLGFCALPPPLLAGQGLENRVRELTQEVEQLKVMILELRTEISRSREETRDMRLELQRVSGGPGSGSGVVEFQARETSTTGDSNLGQEERLAQLEESQQLLHDRIEEQYQTKVESASKYRTKLSGLVMLNIFGNRGRVEHDEDPGLALRQGPTDTGGSAGLSALQSQVGFETYGPTFGGARTSAGLQFDFFGFSSSTAYASSWGEVRLRTATVRLDWPRTSIIVGQDAPFISPLSPTSVVSLGYPAFYYSGNLWNWIPQASIEHRLRVSERGTFSFQGGIVDPAPRSSKQPGYATRVAWSSGDTDRPLTLGIGGFYSRQNYGAGRTEDGWAGTADWLVPLGSRFGFSGEFFRGRAFGNLGAALGRSVAFSGPESDPSSSIVGLNSVGGWAQLTFKASSSVELHAAYGEEQPYRRDLLYFTPAGSSSTAIYRNRNGMFNIIYRPRTDLLFSMEYRRLKTWRVSPGAENAGHLNLGIGVLF
jgi:hypothetical protein